MGLFDFFKKKPSDSKKIEEQETAPVDNNLYLIEVLERRLVEMGYKAKKHPEYLALIVNDDLEIATVIIDNPSNHPGIIQIMALTIHPEYFPNGIQENTVGIGSSMKEKADSFADNYINTTFLPVINSFSDIHHPDLNFSAIINGREILWHSTSSHLILQGKWNEQPQGEPLFELLKEKVKEKLTINKFNWLKLYVSKQADRTIHGECLFNSEPWEEGLKIITAYAHSWEIPGSFKGLKQFIMFRKCDAYDQ